MTKELVFPEAAIVIVTYNSEKDIERCLRSLWVNCQFLSASHAVVHVVDNASSDGTRMILIKLAKEFDWLQVHLQDKNLGFGRGNNVILNSVPARAYILLNADAWLVGDSFSPALSYLSDSPKTGIIGLPLVYPDGSPQTHFFEPSAWYRWFLLLLGFRGIAKMLVSLAPIRDLMKLIPLSRNFVDNHGKSSLNLNDPVAISMTASGETFDVAWVAGAAMIMSAAFVKASGGFDPEIFLYGEDEDICIQAHDLGFSVETMETIPIVHKLGWNGNGIFSPHVARLKYKSLKYFINKNVPGVFNYTMMSVLLPVYVYGRNIAHFFRKEMGGD